MGRIPCCDKDQVNKGQWTPEEDAKLTSYISQHGTRNWRLIPKNAGLQRCGKSCRLRWTNYLRPDLKHGEFTEYEEQTIVRLHAVVGNRWSLITAQLPGRTDNDVKNYWNTKLKKKLSSMGIDPVTHKPFSHLMAEIAAALPPPQVANLADAALGCFKDEMLHLLTNRRMDYSCPTPITTCAAGMTYAPAIIPIPSNHKIKLSISRAIMQEEPYYCGSAWPAGSLGGPSSNATSGMWMVDDGFANGSAWSPSMCTGSSGDHEGGLLHEKRDRDTAEGGKNATDDEASMFNLWDLPDDILSPTV